MNPLHFTLLGYSIAATIVILALLFNEARLKSRVREIVDHADHETPCDLEGCIAARIKLRQVAS